MGGGEIIITFFGMRVEWGGGGGAGATPLSAEFWYLNFIEMLLR